jgi:hypothetical protein
METEPATASWRVEPTDSADCDTIPRLAAATHANVVTHRLSVTINAAGTI